MQYLREDRRMGEVKCQMNRCLLVRPKPLNSMVWKPLRKCPKRIEKFPAVVDQNDPMHAVEKEEWLRSSNANPSPLVNSPLGKV